MNLRRYNPFPEKHRWPLFMVLVLLWSIIILLMGLRTSQVALSLTLGLYLAWIFRRG